MLHDVSKPRFDLVRLYQTLTGIVKPGCVELTTFHFSANLLPLDGPTSIYDYAEDQQILQEDVTVTSAISSECTLLVCIVTLFLVVLKI